MKKRHMKKFLILFFITLTIILCAFCLLVIIVPNIQMNIDMTNQINTERSRLFKLCNDSDIVQNLKKEICNDYNKEGGCNNEDYGKPADLCSYNASRGKLFKLGSNNDLILYLRSRASFQDTLSEFFVQYKGEFIGKYPFWPSSMIVFPSETSDIVSDEKDNIVWFYFINQIPSGAHQLFEFNKTTKELKYYYIDDTIYSIKNYSSISLSIETRKIIFLSKENTVVREFTIDSKAYDPNKFID